VRVVHLSALRRRLVGTWELAIGDEAAEDLFVLAADTGLENITVVLSPVDFRTGASLPETVRLPEWTTPLYSQIRARLAELPPEEMRRP